MYRRRLAIPATALLALLVIVVAACSPATTSPTPAPASGGPSAGATVPASEGPVSPVAGVVTSVDPPAPPEPSSSAKASASPARSAPPVVGFTLLTSGGDALTFVLGTLDDTSEIGPDDLYDRLASQDPLLVFFTVQDGKLVVYHLEDAG